MAEFGELYQELRRVAEALMRGERDGHTLQPTALLNECFLRLDTQPGLANEMSGTFLAAAATTMRRILVDHARARTRDKRGGGWTRRNFDVLIECFAPEPMALGVFVDLDEALERLSEIDELAASIIDIRFFCGKTIRETSVVLELSPGTVVDHYRSGLAWLRERMK